MEYPNRWAVTALLVIALDISSVANAALVSRLSGQAVYDTDRNITWLTDANLAASNAFGVSGISGGAMNWYTAQDWIAAMNAASYLGVSDWRLPSSNICSGYNCTGSEMGHLYYTELLNTGGPYVYALANAGPFSNFQNSFYWSGTNTGSVSDPAVWNFSFYNGYQGSSNMYSTLNDTFYALVVRSGDVVPVPAAVWLFGSGLAGLVGFARRKKRAV